MNYISKTSASNNRFLHAIGATSWNDAALCFLVYAFISMFVFSLMSVVVTFVGALFSGLMVANS